MKKALCLFCLVIGILSFGISSRSAATLEAFNLIYPSNEALVESPSFGWQECKDHYTGGLKEYDLYIDNTLVATTEFNRTSITLSSTLPDGPHLIFVKAISNDSSSMETPSRYFYVNESGPTYKVYADGITIETGSTIRRLPIIKALIYDPCGIDLSTISITMDGSIESPTIEPIATWETYTTVCSATFKINTPLSNLPHILIAGAKDRFWPIPPTQNPLTISNIKVLGTVNVIGVCKNYPNPFQPLAYPPVTTKIAYKLSEDGNINIYIFDIAGNIIKRISANAGEQDSTGMGKGGRQGDNDVEWDGVSDFGTTVGNGVYPYFIVSEGKVIGNGQVAVYD